MPKRRTRRKPTNDPNLTKIIVGICVVLGAVLIAARYVPWERHRGDEAEAATGGEIERARELIRDEAFKEAEALLEPVVNSRRSRAAIPDAMLLMADIRMKEGRAPEARAMLQQVIDQYPQSPARPDAMLRLAALLQEEGQRDEATALLRRVEQETPPEIRAGALVALGREAQAAGNRLDARTQFVRAVEDAAWGSDAFDEALEALGALNVEMIFSPAETPESKVYVVEPGDNLTSIGIKLNTTLGLLMRANNIDDPARLQVGQRLKWTPKDFHIIIDRRHCLLYLMDKDGVFKRYRVGLGKPGYETTLGKYRIGNKEKDPTWHKQGEEPIPPGDPRNELGTRWMPLVPVEEGLPTDLGIHGTIDPPTIGYHSSAGCARMLPADVEELYDLVVRSTPVEIVEEYVPAGHAVAAAS